MISAVSCDRIIVCVQTVRRITSVMSRCHADLRGLGGKYVCGSAFSIVFSLISLARSSLFSFLLTTCCVLFNTFISKIQNLCYICSPPLRHLLLSSHLLTDLTSYLLSLLLSSHLFLYLLHHFYILNHQKLTFMFYIYKLNIYIFSFFRSRATRRLVL